MRTHDRINRSFSWVRKEPESSFEKNITQNAFISVGCSVVELVTRFFIPPIVLSFVSLDIYGLWAYCFIFINYVGMSMIGITNVYIRYSAVYLAERNLPKVNRLLSTGVICAAAMSIITILLAWNYISLFFPILQVPPDHYHTAFVLIFGTLAIFSLELIVNAFKFLLHGLQKIGLQRMIHTTTHFLESILIILFLYLGHGIYSLLYAYVIQVCLANIAYAVISFSFVPDLRISWRSFDPSMLGIFFRFGGTIQLRSLLGILNRSLARLLGGIFVGTQATALIALGEKFPVTVTNIPANGMFVFLPASTHLHATGRKDKIRALYLYGCRYMSMLSGLMLGFLTPFALFLTTFWLGPDQKYHAVALILACLAIPYHILVVTGPASSAFRSINKPVIELVYGIFELGLCAAAAAAGLYYFGYGVIVICASIGSMIFLTSVAYLFYTNVFLEVCQREFLSKVIVPGFLPYAIAGILALICSYWQKDALESRWTALLALSLAWAVYMMISVPLYVRFILEQDEKNHIRAHYWERLRARLLPSEKKQENGYRESIGKAETVCARIFFAPQSPREDKESPLQDRDKNKSK